MRTQFITSCAQPGTFPQLDVPEIAFSGRSNVGKSALLNALANARLARTSRTPGRTQLVNFFRVDTGTVGFGLADLPGYGFARAPKSVQRTWAPLIEDYLESRSTLRCLLILIDVRRGVQPDDAELMIWAKAVLPPSVTIEVVGTKIDKLPKSKQKPALHAIARDLEVERHSVHGTSATTRQGLEVLWERLQVLVQSV